MSMLLLLLAAFFQAVTAAPEYPPQPPITALAVETCRGPEYSDDEYRAMARVVEVPEARAKFPGSYLFVPATPGAHPGIIALHGSGGGRYTPGMMCNARLLASRGYATLAFCYFDCGAAAIPEALSNVDLRRTYEAMLWLKRSPHVRGRKVVLSGASRGAEQAVLLASLLGRAAKSDSSIVVPDALYASAPYGRVVGAFNWRANADDDRWRRVRLANAPCMRADPAGPYRVEDGKRGTVAMRWDSDAPACAHRPALDASECWVADPAGRHTGPDSRPRTWLTRRCAAEPNRRGSIFDRPAWKWDRDPDGVRPGIDIRLRDYGRPVLVVHGSADPIWPVEDGTDHLRRTLARNGVASHREVVARVDTRVPSWSTLPADRVLFYIFEGEPHVFSARGAVARRNLFLAFLERSLR
jgi:hypothetical protein